MNITVSFHCILNFIARIVCIKHTIKYSHTLIRICNIYLDSFFYFLTYHISCFISSMLFTNWKLCLRDSVRICVPAETSSKSFAHQKRWSVQKYLDHYTSPFLLFFNISSSRHNSRLAVRCPEDPSCVGVHFPSLQASFTSAVSHPAESSVPLWDCNQSDHHHDSSLPTFPSITRIYNFDMHTNVCIGWQLCCQHTFT